MSSTVSTNRHVGSDDDGALLSRLAAGDAGVPLETLYDRYARRLYSMGRRLLNDDGFAQELVQETFVRLWKSAARFDPNRGSAAAFIFAIARNIAIDLHRRPSSRPFEEAPADVVSPDLVDGVLTGMTVREALAELSPQHREVLELIYREGHRAVDVAGQLGIPVGTVRTRSFYALRALADALDRLGFDPAWAVA